MKSSLTIAKSLLGLVLIGTLPQANATLYDRGSGMIYDSDQDLTWLQDANYAVTSGYAAANLKNDGGASNDDILGDGRMGWDAAMTWATGLSFGGFSDWRLASVTDVGDNGCTTSNGGNGGAAGTDCYYNTDTSLSELAYMFHENLGNNSWYDTSGTATGCTAPNYCLENTSADGVDILNLQSDVYWSGTEYAPNTNDAWRFNTDDGYQSYRTKNVEFYAWAVRSGDVSAVPVPAAVWLFGSGLVGLIGVSRRKRRHLALR